MASKASDLGERLLKQALVSRDKLQHGVEAAARTRRSLAAALVDLGYVAAEPLARFICEQYRLPRVDLCGVTSDPDALAAVPQDVRSCLRVVPVRVRRSVLVIAVDDPSDPAIVRELERITLLHPEPVIASVPELDAALVRLNLNA